jgi:uncharacterized protein DUF6917
MPRDPYAAGLVESKAFPFKRDVVGQLVVVSRNRIEGRKLDLIEPRTRCINRFEVHELIVTDEDARPGGEVQNVAYWGFFETEQSGVLQVGDLVEVGGRVLARVAGFDLSHAPNHLNIVLRAESRTTGLEYDFKLGDRVVFRLDLEDAS